ncbi:MAG: hypothetical protein KA712_01985 [Myxococcales bacterium]|nr:hypothetical protein [Myxococcales bacterium]
MTRKGLPTFGLVMALLLGGGGPARGEPEAPPLTTDVLSAPVPSPSSAGQAEEDDEAARILREVTAETATDAEPGLVAESEPRLLVYGFLDAGLQRYVPRDEDTRALLVTPESTFVSGNTNVYFDVRPVRGWRALVETRLTLLPHGDYQYAGLGPATRTNTRILDTTSPSGRNVVQLGGVVVERSQIEYSFNDALNVRVGYFFTPWGIWNVDHGTPTLISLMMPAFLVQEAIPQRQTGLEVYGRWNGPPWQVSYAAYASNGRTSTLFDLTDDKALGGRVVASRLGAAAFAVGLSAYSGTSGDETKRLVLNAAGHPTFEVSKRFAFIEQMAGLDLSVDLRGLRLRLEGVYRRTRYDEGLREASVLVPGAFLPNFDSYFGYLIAAYRCGRHFEPYVYAEYGDGGLRNNVVDSGYTVSGGLNIYFTPYTQLKTQYAEVRFDNFSGSDHRLGFFTSRLVLAF